MEIFGIGPFEALLIFVLALIVIGPGKMPEVAASLGKMLREFRAASAELTDALNAEIAEAERRKTAVAAGENGHVQHAEAEAAGAEIVAQGEIEAPAAVEFTSSEAINYEYESPAKPEPLPAATIDDVLAAIAQQEAEETAKREAEEKARLAAIALERDIRAGVGPLPESLLVPSTDAPLVVVNPTEQRPPEPAATEVAVEPEAPADASAPGPNGEAHDPGQALESPAPDGKLAEAESETESESLEASGAGQAEVL